MLSVSRPMEVVVFELLGDGYEGDSARVQRFNDLGKVGQAASQTIDLVDHDGVDFVWLQYHRAGASVPADLDFRQNILHRRSEPEVFASLRDAVWR
jgi:hypothetical protein